MPELHRSLIDSSTSGKYASSFQLPGGSVGVGPRLPAGRMVLCQLEPLT